LKNPAYHHSLFWNIEKKEHEKRVRSFMSSLDKKMLPEVYKVFITPFMNKKREEESIEKTVENILRVF
jgi:hypothetical protein